MVRGESMLNLLKKFIQLMFIVLVIVYLFLSLLSFAANSVYNELLDKINASVWNEDQEFYTDRWPPTTP